MIKPVVQPLQALLLDDEEDACKNLLKILQRDWEGKINVLGIAMSTEEAEEIMSEVIPDVIFIDIEMPGENAFQFLERIQPFEFEIIFVTAYDEYALRALKLNAVDYILKPISLGELAVAIQKLEEKIAFKLFSKRMMPENNFSALNAQILQKTTPDRIVLKSKTEFNIVYFKDILYVEANGSYAHFYFLQQDKIKSIMMSRPLVSYEDLLPLDIFYRIHKSYLINCHHVKRVNKNENYSVEMKNQTVLPLSRRRHAGLIAFLKNLQS